MEQFLTNVASVNDKVNGFAWGWFAIILLLGTGLTCTVITKCFQISHIKHWWVNTIVSVFKKDTRTNEEKGAVSQFQALCTALAATIGTGNIAGVALAVFRGGPGTLFWMWVVGILNSAISFVECSLSQLYKTKIDGEYRGSGAYCAERGLGQRWLGCILSIVLGITPAFFMPAAGTYTISNLFNTAAGVPNWVTSGILAIMLGVIIFGGVKRIGKISSILVPIKVLVYFGCFLLILGFNITKVPQMFVDIFSCAFSVDAAVWGGIAYAFMQGCNRGTFACAAGMGEAMPAAAASETNHPVKQGFVNAGGVWICVIGVCTCTGFMLLLTDCYCTDFGYVGAGVAGLKAAVTAAQRGHKVVLCEKTDKVGGILKSEQAIPFKREMYELGLVLERQAQDEGVEIRLNTTVTPEYVEKEGVDALILAVGSTPVVPPIPGIDSDNVIIVNDYYLNKEKVGDSVVVLGGGLAGCECAVHLGMEGKKVELVEMRDTLAPDCNIRHRPILMRKVAEFTTAHTEYAGQKITSEGVICKDKDGNEVLVPGKTVVCAVGQRANRADVDALRYCAPFVREIGDCIRPANITKAIYEAYHAALDI